MKYQAVFASVSSAARLARRRLFVLLMALTMAAAVRTSAWSAGVPDIIWLESNSTAGNSILTFKNEQWKSDLPWQYASRRNRRL